MQMTLERAQFEKFVHASHCTKMPKPVSKTLRFIAHFSTVYVIWKAGLAIAKPHQILRHFDKPAAAQQRAQASGSLATR
jgi:hypothetical protein